MILFSDKKNDVGTYYHQKSGQLKGVFLLCLQE